MIYEIQTKSDMLSGTTLIVKIPEEDLDKKALCTIREDKPSFILPFRHRIIDGQVEIAYQIGAQSKLQYLAGDRNPDEYAGLWSGVLSPLIDCGDWFLRPYSFVLDIKHLYCDKSNNSISYVYIPSIRDFSNYSSLKEMAADFGRLVTVMDAELENKVLRALMMDFNPKTFMQMLKLNTAAAPVMSYTPAIQLQHVCEQKAFSIPMPPTNLQNEDTTLPEKGSKRCRERAPVSSGEIVIDISSDWKPVKKGKKSKKNENVPEVKKEKQAKNRKTIGGRRGKTPEVRQDIITRRESLPQQPQQPPSQIVPSLPAPAPIEAYEPIFSPVMESASITQYKSLGASGAWLRLIGNAPLPPAIDVGIAEGEVFTLGRYDTSAGKQQSNFEFEKNTKAVSRRHAVIERCIDGYSLIDLSSSAGTFLDGQKLPANTPCKMQPGCRVSFGNCGADYIWEQ